MSTEVDERHDHTADDDLGDDDAAQLEDDDDAQLGDDDDDAPEAQAAPMTEKELSAAIDKLDREAKRHRDRLGEIMGEDALVLLPCALCEPNVAGFRFPGPVDDQRRAAVLEAIGWEAPPDFKQDPDATTCDLCDGLGELVTGSRVATQLTRACPKCGANGWTTPDQRLEYEARHGAQQVARELAYPPPPTAAATAEAMPERDAWSRPLGHEFYGRSPVYMTSAERARDWHGVA